MKTIGRCMSILLCAIAGVAQAGNWGYYVEGNGAVITSAPSDLSGAVTVPSQLGGYPVVSIGDWVGQSRDSITALTIPESVTNIGRYAFANCDKLAIVTIGTNVQMIGESAFSGTPLMEVEGLVFEIAYIGNWAMGFKTCIVEDPYNTYPTNDPDVLVRAGTKHIADSAFGNLKVRGQDETSEVNCSTGWGMISLPDGLLTIGQNAFQQWGLNYDPYPPDVTIPASVVELGDGALSSLGMGGRRILFQGDRPQSTDPFNLSWYSEYENLAVQTVYYVDGKSGWTYGGTWCGVATYPWSWTEKRTSKITLGPAYEYNSDVADHELQLKEEVEDDEYVAIPVYGATSASEINPVVVHHNSSAADIAAIEIRTDAQMFSAIVQPLLKYKSQWNSSSGYYYIYTSNAEGCWPTSLWPDNKAVSGRYWIVIKPNAGNWYGMRDFRVGLFGTDEISDRIYLANDSTYGPAACDKACLDTKRVTYGGKSAPRMNYGRAFVQGGVGTTGDCLGGTHFKTENVSPASFTATVSEPGMFVLTVDDYDSSYNQSTETTTYIGENYKSQMTVSGGTIPTDSEECHYSRLMDAYSMEWPDYEDYDDDYEAYQDAIEEYQEQCQSIIDEVNTNQYWRHGGGACVRRVTVGKAGTYTFASKSHHDIAANRVHFFPAKRKSVAVDAICMTAQKFYMCSHDIAYGYVLGSGVFVAGETVTFTAVPAPDNQFDHWEVAFADNHEALNTALAGQSMTSPTLSFTVTDAMCGEMTEEKQIVIRAVWKEKRIPEIIPSPIGAATVSGNKEIFEGENVTVTLKPNTNCSFVRWIDDADCGTSRTFSFDASGSDEPMRAIFNGTPVNPVPHIEVENLEDSYAVGAEIDPISVGVESGTGYSVKVTGLPAGLSYASGRITGIPTKTGSFTVTATATKSGASTLTSQFTINVTVVFTYEETEDGIILTGTTSTSLSGQLVIPSTYDGKKVVTVGVEEDDGHKQGIFSGTAITGVVVSEGIEELSYAAFYGCSKLSSVQLPSSLKVIRARCFEGCTSLKKVELPEGLTTLERDWLKSDSGVTTLNLPSTLVNIEEGALAIGSVRTYTVAAGNPRYRVENGYVYDYVNNVVFMRANYYQKTFVIPEGAVRIAECCFGDCDNGDITVPSSVRELGPWAFCECAGLTVRFLGAEPDVDDSWPHGDLDPNHLFEGSSNVMIYVTTGQGWDDIVATGTWQGCPIKMKTFVTVTAGEGGTATGGGAYDSGTKITLRATAAKGYAFAGWYEGATPYADGDADYRTASMALTVPARNLSLTAKFVTAAEDGLYVSTDDGVKQLSVGESVAETLEVDTESFPTVTVTGLPAGMKFDAKTLKFSGAATKAGVYDITIAAKNSSGYTYTTLTKMIVTGAAGSRVTNHFPVVYGTVGQELRKPNGDHYFDVDFFDFDTPHWGDGRDDDGEYVGYSGGFPGFSLANYRTDLQEDPIDKDTTEWYRPYRNWIRQGDYQYTGPYHPFIATPTKSGNYVFTLNFKWHDNYRESIQTVFIISDRDELSALEDADGNPLIDLSVLDDTWTVGSEPPLVNRIVDPAAVTSLTMSGLPTGVTFAKLTGLNGAYYGFTGFPTKAGRFTVTVKATYNAKAYTTVKTVTVADAQCAYYSVLSTDDTRGTATGSGVRKPGDRMTVTAKPAKNFYFAGWYSDADCTYPAATLGADWRTASQTFYVSASTPNPLYARFVTKAEDAGISVSCVFPDGGYTAGQAMSATVTVESASFPTVTAKGLPAGVKFDAKTLVLSGTPTTPGEYPVTFTAKNVSGATASTTATFKVNNYICSLNYLDEPLQDSYDFTPGVAIDGDAVFGSQVLAELGLGGWTVTGLPAGITYNAKTGTFSGAATVASKNYTVTFTKKEGSVVKEIGTSIFRTAAYPKLSLVAVIDGDTYETKTNGWRLVGAGAHPANKAISLSATAPSGFVFTGWTFDEAGSDPLSNGKQDFRTSSGYSYTTLAEDTTLYAHFTHKRNDDVLTMDLESSYTINSVVEMQLSVQSWSLPTVKATGLPTGLKFDAKTLVLSGTPTKPGKYTVTFTLSNLSVKNVTQTTEITVPNIVSDVIGGIESNEDYYQYTQGVAIGDGIVPEVEDGYALSVSGLPSGLSYDRTTGKITGAPTAKPGAYTVTFTATKRGAATETATITLNIAAAPTSAVGVFNGFVGRDEGASFVNLGTFKLTSAANGALSAAIETAKGKTSLTAKNWTSYDGYGLLVADFSDRSGNAVHIVIDVSLGFDAWQLSGTFYEAKSGTTHDLIAQMNVFGQSWYFKATAAGTDAWTLAYAESASSADLTVTTKADGTATIKGKLGTYTVNATSFLATDGLKEGAFMADFVQFVTVSGTKYPLSIRANLWLDGSDAHTEGAGSAKIEE